MRLYSVSVRAGLALLFAAAAVAGGRTQGQPKVTGQPVGSGRVQLESIKLPPGFRISLFADGVKNARSMA